MQAIVTRVLSSLTSYVFWAIVFGVSYTQAPLYYSNQNQYFLHGLAAGGHGCLRDDWLANTADPTPLFSALVRLTYLHLDESCFYLFYFVLFGLYFLSLLGIATAVVPEIGAPPLRFCFSAALLAIHSALLRLLCAHWLGSDYFWYAQAGLAGQYVLGAMFQPSVFGVLLLCSIWLFLEDKPALAAVCAALAAICHATYFLGAATLTMTYVFVLLKKKRLGRAAFVGVSALVLVLPILVHDFQQFRPSSSEQFWKAQRILAHVRIPHHALLRHWFNGFSCAQLLGILAAAVIARKSKLAPVFWASLGVLTVLTLIQLWTGNDTLALIFPWRLSVYLVPMATAVLLGKLVALAGVRCGAWLQGHRRLVFAGNAILVGSLVMGGIVISKLHLAYRVSRAELPLLQFARSHATAGQVYLLPCDVPRNLPSNTSHIAAHFTDDRATERHLPELQTFRLRSGVPIFVDLKSIPYKDTEVLEWYRRIGLVQQAYAWIEKHPHRLAEWCAENGITHVVTVVEDEIRASEFQPLYADSQYRIYKFSTTRKISGSHP